MAVYSYKTGSVFIEIDQYANEEVGVLSSFVLSEFIGQNNLFSINSKTNYSSESYLFSYNLSSTLYTLSEDYGSISGGEPIISDYADALISSYSDTLISDLLSPEFSFDDYGSILSTPTSFEVYGIVADDNTVATSGVGKIRSATKYSVLRVSEIQGTVFLFQGKSNYYINSSHIGYGSISYSNGISSEKNTESYVGAGRAFGFDSKAERVVTSYNNSSVVYYEGLDYGSIGINEPTISDYANETISTYSSVQIGSLLPPGVTSEDYGSILDDPNLPAERDDYGLVTGRGLRPFGLTSFHSSLIEKNTEDYVGSGNLFNFGNVKVLVLPIHYGKGLLKIRGEYSNLKNTESYVGTGRAFGFGSKAERTTASYNLSSVVEYEGLDYGSIGANEPTISDYANETISTYGNTLISDLLAPGVTSEDYGSILDDPNLPAERDDYGLVTGRGLRPFGLTSFHSSAIEKNTEDYVGSGNLFNFGNVKVFVLPKHIGRGVLKIRGAYSDLKNTESYVGTGSLFGFGSKAERTAVSYNLSSIVNYEGLDYGSIGANEPTISDYANETISTYSNIQIGSLLSPGVTSEDYGSILDDPNLPAERDDYGLISGRGLRPFGLTSFHSSLIEKNTEDYVGSGKLFNFGNVKVFVLPKHIGRGVLKIRGAYSDLKNTESYVGTGSLFGFGSKAERTTASYNLSSVVDYEGLDYGSIGINEPTISDYANETISTYSNTLIGDLLAPGVTSEDYGSILDDPNLPAERDDYGLITGRGLRPFGLTSFHSSAIEKNTEDYVGSGILFNFGTAKIFVLPSHVGRGVLKIRGAYSDLKNTESYVGTGSLFGFGSKAERTTASYNLSSVVNYEGLDYGSIGANEPTISDYANETIGTYGNTLISDLLAPGVTSEDYGSILDDPNLPAERDDYGLISGRGLRPFGLTRFSSGVIEKNTEDYVGSGILFNFGNIKESSTPTYSGKGILKIRGEYSDLKNTESYVGTGSLFGFGSKAERTTASYNLSSVVDYEGLDYGSIGINEPTISDYANETISTYSNTLISDLLAPGVTSEDYGSITDTELYGQQTENYGLITGRGLRPFGLTRFSSGVIEKNTEDYVGGGSLFIFVSKTETNTFVPTSTGLFKFSGSLVENNTGSYVGTGSLFGFGSKAERTTASYNLSSVVEYEGLDYGSIGINEPTISDYANETISTYSSVQIGSLLPPGVTSEDYGSITDTELYGQQTENYGFITGRGLRPFGLTRFSGHLVEKNTESYVGTGSLFAFSSTTEVFSPKPPVSGLFRISGAATQSITPTAEIGSGSLFTFASKSEAFGVNPPENIQLFKFSGHLVEKNTESYVGTGSLFAFSSTTEVFSPKPPVSGLFRISGAATQSITPTAEIGSGTVTVLQKTTILDAEDKTRLVSAYERVKFEEIAKPEAIKLSGEVGIYFQYFEEGFGTLSVRGRAVIRLKPIHIGGGSYFIRGAAAESTTPATEIGSGSVFTFVSATEASGVNPPEDTALFRFGSSSIVKNTESYVGIGLERINVESLILIRPRYPGSGSIEITPKGLESRIYTQVGSGILFGFGSGTEYFTNAYQLDTFVIRVRGSAADSHTENYVGSGSVFAFTGGVESKGSNPPENIALFKFGGSGSARTQPIYLGEGKLKFSEGSGRPDKNNKTFIVSSDESNSVRTIEEPTQVKIFGFAGTSRPTVYKGRGSLFGFGSRSESVAYSPETKELFRISGSAVEKNTEAYLGSGSIFSIIGSSYSSTARPKETTTLFNINGSANEAFAEAPYNGKGSIITNLQSSSSTSFKPKSTTALFEFVGSSTEKNTEAYNGFGSIGIFISTAKSVFYDYSVSQKAFKIFGNTFESFARSNYDGLSYSIITGSSENQKKEYIPPRRTRIFII